MKISIVKETSPGERRVLVLPSEVQKLVEEKHEILVEKNAGEGIHLYDKDYLDTGAKVETNRQELFNSDFIVKLKAPTPVEFNLLNNNILFSMLHHKQNPKNVYYLGKQNAKAVEIESVYNSVGERLIDQTNITGESGVLYAVQHLEKMPQDSKALILGYGRVGSGAINMCNKLGIKTKILRKDEYINIKHFLSGKDLLINAIAWPEQDRKNKKYVVTSDMIDLLNKGAVVLDLAVDFPNPIQTCRPTDLGNPYYIEKDRIHIGIYGYPGLFPVSSSERYSKQVLPLLLEIANNGGLEKIAEKGDLGKSISKAIVDPKKHDWKKFRPEEIKESFIE